MRESQGTGKGPQSRWRVPESRANAEAGAFPNVASLTCPRRHSYLKALAIIILVNVLVLSVNLASAQSTLETPLAREEIVVTPWGILQVTRTYRFVNLGSSTVPSVSVLLPKEASSITAADDLGLIVFRVSDDEEGEVVTVTFRYPLRGEVEGIAYRDAYTFSICYNLPSSPYLTQREFGVFSLEINVSTGVEFPVTERSVVVTLPEGSTYLSSEPEGYLKVAGLTPIVSYTLTGPQLEEEFHVLVNHRYLPIWSAFRPTLWTGTIVVIIATVVLLRRRFRRAEVRARGRNLEILRGFVNSLDEELDLWEDLDHLERALDDGSLGRKDYNRRRKILDERSRSLYGSRSRLRQELGQVSPRYARLVEQVEAAEGEMSAIRNDLSRLRLQLRAGRLSRSSFERLEASQRRRAGKVKATIETILLTLRYEIGEAP